MNVKFKDWDCKVVLGTYPNGRTAIQLQDIETGMPIASATINVPYWDLQDDQVIIKDFHENKGMLACLKEAGVITSELAVVPLPYAAGHVCGLLMEKS